MHLRSINTGPLIDGFRLAEIYEKVAAQSALAQSQHDVWSSPGRTETQPAGVSL